MLRKTFASASLAAALSLGITLPAQGHKYAPCHPRCIPEKQLRERYTGLRHAVAARFGDRAPGRNLRADGIRTRRGVRPATNHELATSIRTFHRWLSPPVPVASSADVAPTGSVSAPAYTGGKWAIPSEIVMCESHGNYGAVNPNSGARGAYQLMPSTYAAYGGDGSWSPADQDRVAARVWNGGAGRGQWSC